MQNMTLNLLQIITTSFRKCRSGPWGNIATWRTFEPAGPDRVVRVTEVDLFPLIRDALSSCANPAFIDKHFLKEHQTVLVDLSVFNDTSSDYSKRVPSWAPVPAYDDRAMPETE